MLPLVVPRTRGNPQTGTPATDLDDDYFDMLQEELCSVVEASGASLEKGRHDQLLTALRALLLSRKNPFGDIKSDGTVQTAIENLGLGEGAKLNAATATLGRTGFIAIPVMIGGIEQSVIIQWGWNAAKASASGGDGNTVVFPVAFNNACVAVVANYDNVSAPINAVATGGYTTTSFLLRCAAQTGSYYYNWIAIGY